MERINATSRNKIDRVYRDNALFMVVSHISMAYTRSFGSLKLLPEEVFQQVMAWLDKISREEDDDEVRAFIDTAWYEQSLDFGDLVTGARESEVNQATGIVMIFLLTCLIKLGSDLYSEGDFYASLRDSLMRQLMEHMTGFEKTVGEITTDPYYRKHNEEVNRWIAEYMFCSPVTFTDREGRLRTSLTMAGNRKGRKSSVLFTNPDGEKDEETTQYWAKLFNSYLASRHRPSAPIDSKKGNIVLRSIHAFKQYWEEKVGLKLSQSGSAYLSFLTEDCGLPLGEKEDHTPIMASTISDLLTRQLRKKLSTPDEEGDLLSLERFLLSLRKMQ